METLQLEKKKAIDAYDNGTKKEKNFLERLYGRNPFIKDIKDRLNIFKDILEYHGLTQDEFDDNNIGLTPDEVGYRKEKLIVSAYNEGKKPDWNDGTYKYSPYFKRGSSGLRYFVYAHWSAHSHVGSRLCFCGDNAKSNLLDAVEKFLPEYKESRTL